VPPEEKLRARGAMTSLQNFTTAAGMAPPPPLLVEENFFASSLLICNSGLSF
jgi:hypothetical protein